MIRSIRNERGIALVSTLLLMVLGFGIVAIMFRLATQSTKLTKLEQGYTAALDAAKAGGDLFIYMIQNSTGNPPPDFGATSAHNGQCLNVKMSDNTSSWTGSTTWSGNSCPSLQNTSSPDADTDPDITLTLQNGAIPYSVKVKLIDTYKSEAETSGTECLGSCYYYTVISRAEQATSSDLKTVEHAEIYFVYRWDPGL